MMLSPFWGNLAGVVTVVTMLSFIGIWIWVWNGRHKQKYDALARIPMDDEEQSQ
ncbi:cbb3-type cytochrome c oxidase subunit 3 [Dokdonella sp.]|uniref:cbb3-type cytochrome oxidase subunit 3 n=1 Tax=Dokdonella sp. TaxID=2291710 RepID=UPI0025BEB32D|nr:cbb3-type cytochrome c oxidase subunit 3 [Dokdonella sp.]MBX3690039.1 cbb3-type cytochrome c oxidase subunit 3 [Dokdonella sp.]